MSLETIFIRQKNDINGNPIYYVGLYDLANFLGVDVDRLTADAMKAAGFRKYRGKMYGTGYTLQSYNLASDVAHLRDRLMATN